MRIIKVIGIALGIVVALGVVLVAAINLVPGERYKGMISAAVGSATGRETEINGDLDVSLGSRFRFAASDVRFSNASWGSQENMFAGQRIEGDIALAPLLRGVLDLRLVLESPELVLETSEQGQGNWEFESTAEQETEEEGTPLLRPHLREIRIEGAKLLYVDVAAARRHQARFDSLVLRTRDEAVEIELKGSVDEQPLSLAGELQGETLPLEGAADITLSGSVGGVKADVKGTLKDLAAAAGADLTIEASVASLAELSAWAGRPLPDEGPLTLSLRLRQDGDHYVAEDIRADLDGKGTKASIRGRVADVNALQGIALQVDLRTAHLAQMAEAFGAELPVQLPRSLDAAARVEGSREALRVNDFEVNLQDESVRASAKGQVENLMAVQGVTADVSLDADSLSALSRLAGTELPQAEAVAVTARLRLAGSRETLRVNDFEVNLQDESVHVSARGQVENLMAVQGVTADVSMDADSLASLSRFTGTELPKTEALAATGSFRMPAGLDAQAAFSLQFEGEGAKAEVQGNMANVRTAEGITADVRLEGESLQRIGRLAGQDLPALEPFRLHTKAAVSVDKGEYELQALDLKAGENAVTGSLVLKGVGAEQGPQVVRGKLHFADLDIGALTGKGAAAPTDETAATGDEEADTSAADAEQASEKQDAVPQRDKLFSQDPFPVEALRAMDAEVEITSDKLVMRRFVLEDVAARLTLKGGLLEIKPVHAVVGEGSMNAVLKFDAGELPADFSMDVKLENGTSPEYDGVFDIRVDLDGQGKSVAALMAGLDGQIILQARDVQIEESFLTNFGQGLLATMNPVDGASKRTDRLECFIVRLDIDDGMVDAKDKIVFKLPKVTWLGGGSVNLKDETLDLAAQSVPTSGLGIQGLGQLADLVQVGGTLAEPRIEPDPKGLAKRFGETYLTVATGGAYSLVKGLLNRASESKDACADVLEMQKKGIDSPAATGSATSEEPAPAASDAAVLEAASTPARDPGQERNAAPQTEASRAGAPPVPEAVPREDAQGDDDFFLGGD